MFIYVCMYVGRFKIGFYNLLLKVSETGVNSSFIRTPVSETGVNSSFIRKKELLRRNNLSDEGTVNTSFGNFK